MAAYYNGPLVPGVDWNSGILINEDRRRLNGFCIYTGFLPRDIYEDLYQRYALLPRPLVNYRLSIWNHAYGRCLQGDVAPRNENNAESVVVEIYVRMAAPRAE